MIIFHEAMKIREARDVFRGMDAPWVLGIIYFRDPPKLYDRNGKTVSKASKAIKFNKRSDGINFQKHFNLKGQLIPLYRIRKEFR